MSTEEEVRRAFEKDYAGEGPRSSQMFDRQGECYKYMATQSAWSTWKSAWAAALEANRLVGGDEKRHVICLCPDCVKDKPARLEERSEMVPDDGAKRRQGNACQVQHAKGAEAAAKEFEEWAFVMDLDTTRSSCNGRQGMYASEATQRGWQVWKHLCGVGDSAVGLTKWQGNKVSQQAQSGASS